jgi:hypothetical protein
MEQRVRMALLIHLTQQEQLAAYRRAELEQQGGGDTVLACYVSYSRPASEKPETP